VDARFPPLAREVSGAADLPGPVTVGRAVTTVADWYRRVFQSKLPPQVTSRSTGGPARRYTRASGKFRLPYNRVEMTLQ
jgi:hypothetical protein